MLPVCLCIYTTFSSLFRSNHCSSSCRGRILQSLLKASFCGLWTALNLSAHKCSVCLVIYKSRQLNRILKSGSRCGTLLESAGCKTVSKTMHICASYYNHTRLWAPLFLSRLAHLIFLLSNHFSFCYPTTFWTNRHLYSRD